MNTTIAQQIANEGGVEAYLHAQQHKSLLRFLTCGSVDDGKSTLIGRLLHDTRQIYEDQLSSLHNDSKRHGTQGEKLDLALRVDGLQALAPKARLIRQILRVGIPAGIENGMFQFGKLAIQSTVSTMGRIVISAQAMTNILEMVNGVAGMGIGIGLMTVVGQCIGAGRKEEAKYYIVKLTGYAWIAVILSCLFVLAIVKPVTMLAGLEPDSAALCIQMVIAITIVKPIFWTFSFIPAYGMRAAGDVKFSMIVSTCTMWFLRVALCIFLARVYHMGPMAVWIGMFSDWALRGLIFGLRFLSGKWLDKQVI